MTSYDNPVLDADWPDPDAIRVGDDYWMTTSSFNRAPGLPILHSRDLVSWELVGNALPAVPPLDHYALPRHGSGVWAPSLRHHDGRFVIVYPDPDHGIFVLTAPDARGPWTAPWLLLAGKGLIDPCPLWDDDGRTYLVHGWARSRSGVHNRLTVVEVDPGLRHVLDAPRQVVDGDAIPDCRTLEGPKLYQRDGWYWIFAPGGGVATGWQYVFRSRSVYGPYEHRVVLEQDTTPVNGPHQGAWVSTPDGEDWFLHFQDRGVFGRVVHLQPMRWADDGWPRLGEAVAGDDRRGRPVLSGPRPSVAGAAGSQPQREPRRSDRFTATHLGPQWHWQANPQPGWATHAGDGTLRLAALATDRGDLREHPAVLGQQLPGKPSEWTTRVRLGGTCVGARAGVVVLGLQYAWLGLVRTPAGMRVVCRRSVDGGGEDALADAVVVDGDAVDLRVVVDATGTVRFGWRAGPGDDWCGVGAAYPATVGRWIGAEIGLFAVAPVGSQTGPDDVATFGAVSVRVAGRSA
jgi:beta-xylosidase